MDAAVEQSCLVLTAVVLTELLLGLYMPLGGAKMSTRSNCTLNTSSSPISQTSPIRKQLILVCLRKTMMAVINPTCTLDAVAGISVAATDAALHDPHA